VPGEQSDGGGKNERHQETAKTLLGEKRAAALAPKLHAQFLDLENFVRGLAAVRELTPRGSDYLLSFGELLSSLIVADAFLVRGVQAAWVDSRECLVTDTTHTRAVPLMEETREKSKKKIVPLLAKKRIPVMGGFIAASADGIPTTLGRGGSDYSAAIMGAALNADKIEIWTDVEGMMTTDPRLCSGARTIKQISFNEAAELAYFGAKVLHPSTILPAVERNIPVRILNSWRPDGAGTLITAQNETEGTRLTGLASKKDVTVIDITSTRMLMAYGFLRRVFEVFERFRTAVDMVTTSEVSVSVTVDDRRNLDAIVQALSEFSDVSIESALALLCAVGDSLQGAPEIAARVVGVLEEVPLKMISQAASRRNITVVLRQSDLPHAMQRLHEEFFA